MRKPLRDLLVAQAFGAAREENKEEYKRVMSQLSKEERARVRQQIRAELGEEHPFLGVRPPSAPQEGARRQKEDKTVGTEKQAITVGEPEGTKRRSKTKEKIVEETPSPQKLGQPQEDVRKQARPPERIPLRQVYEITLPLVWKEVVQQMQKMAQTRTERLALKTEASQGSKLARLTRTEVIAHPLTSEEKGAITVRVGALPEWIHQLRQASITVSPEQGMQALEEGIGLESVSYLRALKGRKITEPIGKPFSITITDVQILREQQGQWTLEVQAQPEGEVLEPVRQEEGKTIDFPEGKEKEKTSAPAGKTIYFRFPVRLQALSEWQQAKTSIPPTSGWEEHPASKKLLGQILSSLLGRAEQVSTATKMRAQAGTSTPILHVTAKYRATLPPESYADLHSILMMHETHGQQAEDVQYEIREEGITLRATFPREVRVSPEDVHTELQTLEVNIPSPTQRRRASAPLIGASRRLAGVALTMAGVMLPAMTMGVVGFRFPILGPAMRAMAEKGLSLLSEEGIEATSMRKYANERTEKETQIERTRRRGNRRIFRAFAWLAGEIHPLLEDMVATEKTNEELRNLLITTRLASEKVYKYGAEEVRSLIAKTRDTQTRRMLQRIKIHPVGLSSHPAYSNLLELTSVAYARAGEHERKSLSELMQVLSVGIVLVPKTLVPFMLHRNVAEGNLRELLKEMADTVMEGHPEEKRQEWAQKAYARVDRMLTSPHLRLLLSTGRPIELTRKGDEIYARIGDAQPLRQAVAEVFENSGHVPSTALLAIGALSPQMPSEISSFAGVVFAVMPYSIRELFLPDEKMQKGSVRFLGSLLSVNEAFEEIEIGVPIDATQEERLMRFALAKDLKKAVGYLIRTAQNTLYPMLKDNPEALVAYAVNSALQKLASAKIEMVGDAIPTWGMWGTCFEAVDNPKVLATSYLNSIRQGDKETAQLYLIRAAGKMGNPNDDNLANSIAMLILSQFRHGGLFRKVGEGFSTLMHPAHFVVSLVQPALEQWYGSLMPFATSTEKEELENEARAVALWLHKQMTPNATNQIVKDISLPATIRALSRSQDAFNALRQASQVEQGDFSAFQSWSQDAKTRHVLKMLTALAMRFAERFFLMDYRKLDALSSQPDSELQTYPLTHWRVAWKRAWKGEGSETDAMILWQTFPHVALAEMYSIVHIAGRTGSIDAEEEHDIEKRLRELAGSAERTAMPSDFPALLQTIYGREGILRNIQREDLKLTYTGFVNHPNGLNPFVCKLAQSPGMANYHLNLPFSQEVQLTLPETPVFHPEIVSALGMGYKTTSYARSLHKRFLYDLTEKIPLGFDAPVDQQIYRSLGIHATLSAYAAMPSMGGIPAAFIPQVEATIVSSQTAVDASQVVQSWLEGVYQAHEMGRQVYREVFLLAAAQNAHLVWHEREITAALANTEIARLHPVLITTVGRDFRRIREAFTTFHLEMEKLRLHNYEMDEEEKIATAAWQKVLTLDVHPLSHLLFHHMFYEMAQASQRWSFWGGRSVSVPKQTIDALRESLVRIAENRSIPLRMLNAAVMASQTVRVGKIEEIAATVAQMTEGIGDPQLQNDIMEVYTTAYEKGKSPAVYATVSYRVAPE